jgi:histidine triad (HIT) family protein
MYDENNVFAKIIRGEIPCDKIFGNEYALSFWDRNPVSTKHALVVPKGTYAEYYDFAANASPDEILGFTEAVRRTVEILGVQGGFNTVTNSIKPPFWGQSVPHFHLHIIGGEKKVEPENWA